MPVAYARRVATLLLRFAIWIAPHDTLDWGNGMLSELNHVQGSWAALIWAIGGAGVLAKHAVLAVILPGSHRRTVPSAGELFAKEGPMRKTTLAAIVACTPSDATARAITAGCAATRSPRRHASLRPPTHTAC